MEEIKNAYREIVVQQASIVREKIKNGVIYGIPVDANNTEQLLLAAYLLGLQEGRNELYST